MLKVEVPKENYHQELVSCQMACPVHTDARGYVRAIAEGRFEEAYLIARGPNPFASICGRICGAPCEVACRRGKIPRLDDDGNFIAWDRPISIRALKRFACEQFGPDIRPTQEVLENIKSYIPKIAGNSEEIAALLQASISKKLIKASGEKIAIIGAGPAGLSAAHDLALMGFSPVVFETEPVAAGMLALGVPAYRLPRDLIVREIEVIKALGVEICCNTTIGRDISFAKLRKNFAAVLIAVGAKSSRSLNLPGEQGPRVYGAVDLLRAVSLGESLNIGQDIVVIGGGNVAYDVARTVLRQIAYDVARTAKRLTSISQVWLVSLESLEEMPADTLEILEGDEEGIIRMNGWGPLEILRSENGSVKGVTFKRCLQVYDENKRFAPVFDDNVCQTISCDTVLLAVGQSPNLSFLKDGGSDIEEFRPSWPKVNPQSLSTTAKGVFVAGDLAHGTRLLIDAVASGKKAARSIYEYLTGRSLTLESTTAHIVQDNYRREAGYENIPRVEIPVLEAEERLHHPDTVVEKGYSFEQAIREASRCLDCGVTPVFDGNRCVLCGGCADVCPTDCLKLVSLSEIIPTTELNTTINNSLGQDQALNLDEHSAILKDEDRCIRCALCEMRCPVDAITMERVTFSTLWRSQ
ncbi:MAG: FAD-dependent oxidoreductase [Acidobacteria bacterium]|nr:FAD-dependent oxidoreductase [Acidobacteriota bacterium]